MFLGPKLTSVFASRWKALLWSAGVLLTAYSLVPTEDEGTNSAQDDAAVKAAVELAGGTVSSQASPAPAGDPWRK
ncbi:MAG: hypothetical protein JSS36_05000 [Proteobacteria bacterium]|nr:hypothetical protein [Pseudomonadota bacterium]